MSCLLDIQLIVNRISQSKFKEETINTIVSSIQDDDLYNQTSAFPSPEHRSTALSTQASVIFVLLYFKTSILDKEFTKMREIVDKHFADNWVLPYYMGYTIDLTLHWDQYKAAKQALVNTLLIENVKEIVEKYQTKLASCTKKTKEYLTEGELSEEMVMTNINNLVNLLRDATVCLRWIILHRDTAYKKAADLIKVFTKDQILTLLLNTSQFEFLLKKLFTELVESKQQRWDDDKNSCCEKMTELADFFAQPTSLNSKIAADNNYKQYFTEIKN
jgi:WASH complex subunit strumpellin